MLQTASFWHRTDLPRYSIAISQPRGMCLAKVSVMAPPPAMYCRQGQTCAKSAGTIMSTRLGATSATTGCATANVEMKNDT